jgi:hypothetical protein
MKKCEHFKDLILTDYIDRELDKARASDLESHLLDCEDCRVFFKEVKSNVAVPFERIGQQPVPAELWGTIKQNIERKNQEVNPLEYLIDKLKGIVVFPRVVPVFASLALMFIVGSMTLNNMQVRQAQEKDQGEYLVSLLSPTAAASSAENNDSGSPIEHYFL